MQYLALYAFLLYYTCFSNAIHIWKKKKQFQNPYFIPFIPDFCIIIICQQSSWAADNICQIDTT